jgi:hypothetical protein
MKKRHGLFFGFAVLLITTIFTLAGCDSSGGGDDPIQIETATQFAEIRNNLSGHYILANDINLSGIPNFEPIGRFEPASANPEDEENPNLSVAFTGVFDGNGHKISNVTISAPTGMGVGLFGCVAGTGGVVKNLVVENVTVSGMMLVGGIIGYGAIGITVDHITLQGTNSISASLMAGGIVGGGFGPITNCEATATITAADDNAVVGIIAGGMEDSSIINCTARGTIIVTGAGAGGIGGLAGCVFPASEIKNCTAEVTINITGSDCMMIGGLVGFTGDSNPTVISNCTVNAVITAPDTAERIGGIVGSGFYVSAYKEYFPIPSGFKVQNCSSSGSITSTGSLIGTIAGYIYDNSTVESSTSTMTINSSSGALVGGNKATVDLDGLKYPNNITPRDGDTWVPDTMVNLTQQSDGPVATQQTHPQ